MPQDPQVLHDFARSLAGCDPAGPSWFSIRRELNRVLEKANSDDKRV